MYEPQARMKGNQTLTEKEEERKPSFDRWRCFSSAERNRQERRSEGAEKKLMIPSHRTSQKQQKKQARVTEERGLICREEAKE